eukprot:TRINITY_DN58811_c0_g1_i1.p2 TRINITY_DN58811_c0_g1~~TRINITY_DN58811_c0_g1_i1.p2  ORF type:complete len:120 (-),score=31.39 TRINITY_DN58811_c0_g1_i1:187-546(-)
MCIRDSYDSGSAKMAAIAAAVTLTGILGRIDCIVQRKPFEVVDRASPKIGTPTPEIDFRAEPQAFEYRQPKPKAAASVFAESAQAREGYKRRDEVFYSQAQVEQRQKREEALLLDPSSC